MLNGYFSGAVRPLWFSFALSSIALATAHTEPGKITINSATYGDERYTCSPDLSFCNGIAFCSFEVGDGLCALDANADPDGARNLIVDFFCGTPIAPKAVAAAKGTKIAIDCQF